MDILNITPYEHNAKKHPQEQLQKIANSIKRFGFRQPIVLDKDNVIVVGHGRYLAASTILLWNEYKEDGYSKKGVEIIPYVYADDLSEDEIKAYRLADNKLNESDWEMDKVNIELEELDEELQALTGFGLDEIDGVDEIDVNDFEDVGVISFKFPSAEYQYLLKCLANANEKLQCESNEEVLMKLLSKYE